MSKFVGSIPLIGGITPKNNGNFALVDAKDVQVDDKGKRLDAALAELGGQSTATQIPESGVVDADVMYFLGEVMSITVGFPDTAPLGSMAYVSFLTGAIAPTLEVTTSNTVGLSSFKPTANKFVELIGLWNGNVWVFVTNEVTL